MDPASSGGSDDPFSMILAVVACLLFSFLFAGSETAITSMGEHRVRRLIDDKKGPQRLLELWLSDPSSVLTTLLAGNTLANILGSALTTSLFIGMGKPGGALSMLGEYAVSVGVFLLTMVVLVAGEIAPKTLAKSSPEWFLRPLSLVWVFHVMTTWLTVSLSRIAKFLVGLLGVDTERGSFLVTEEQIEDMVRLSSQEGSIDENRGTILQNVFDLDDISVRSIMTPRTDMVALRVDMPLAEVLEKIRSSGLSRFPVYEGTKDEVIGIFYAKKLLDLVAVDADDFDLSTVLAEAMFVPETQKASRLLTDFQARAVHMGVVVDEHGGTSGIVTLEDVLEELVGEIYDEDDRVENMIEPTGPDSWIVDASTELRLLEDMLDLEWPETDSYSTVGGFCTEQIGHVPQLGETITWRNLQFTVLEADDKRAVRVEVLRLPRDDELDEAS